MWTPLISIPPPRLQHIEYAKTKSYATHRREDPDWVPPTSIYVQNTPNARLANGAGEKRQRDDPMDEDAREVKRDRTSKDADDDDDDDEEMEIEDDEDAPVKPANTANGAQICILSPLRRGSCPVQYRPDTSCNTTAVSTANVPQFTARGHRRCISGPFSTVRTSFSCVPLTRVPLT